jgi:hypothetical protein
MLKFSSLIFALGTLVAATVADAEEFHAPRFATGTEFVIENLNFKYTPVATYTLSFKGVNQKDGSYDFGEYILNKYLARSKKDKPLSNYQPIRFPFHLGDSWKYVYTGGSNANCGVITRHLESRVASSFEKFTVNGTELDVVRIVQDGIWKRECRGNNIEGKNKFEYLYSPKLGMIVYADAELRNPRDALQYNPGYVMKSFSTP